MKLCTAALAALWLSACASFPSEHRRHDPQASSAAFDTLKSLAGTWRGTGTSGQDQQEVTVSYEVVSGGTAVLERLFVGTQHEMITLYHRDGDRLLLTHYCSVGNQPRMELTGWSQAPEKTMTFAFVDATNWAAPKALVMHDVRLSLIDPTHLAATWVAWQDGAKNHAADFDFQRLP